MMDRGCRICALSIGIKIITTNGQYALYSRKMRLLELTTAAMTLVSGGIRYAEICWGFFSEGRQYYR